MYFAREFFVPVVFAVLLNFLLSPVIRVLAADQDSAAGRGGARRPAVGWRRRRRGVRARRSGTNPRQLGARDPRPRKHEAASAVPRAFPKGDEPGRAGGRHTRRFRRPGARRASSSSARRPRSARAFSGRRKFSSPAIVEIVVLLYFLLAGGDLFLQKFIKMLPTLRDKRRGGQRRARDRSRGLGLFVDGIVRQRRRRGRRWAVSMGARHADAGCSGER